MGASSVYPWNALGSLINNPSLGEVDFGSSFFAVLSLLLAGVDLLWTCGGLMSSRADAAIANSPERITTAAMRRSGKPSRVVCLLRNAIASFPIMLGRELESAASLPGRARHWACVQKDVPGM